MRVRRSRPIVVRRAPGRPCQGRVQLRLGIRQAAIGRGSVKPLKREGDGGTPAIASVAIHIVIQVTGMNLRSPLLWDVFAVSTYATVSLLFWYMGMLPDLASMRDHAPTRRRRIIYGIFALGWRGKASSWRHYRAGYLILAGIATPLVLSVHSVVSMDFAVSILPGWHFPGSQNPVNNPAYHQKDSGTWEYKYHWDGGHNSICLHSLPPIRLLLPLNDDPSGYAPVLHCYCPILRAIYQ